MDTPRHCKLDPTVREIVRPMWRQAKRESRARKREAAKAKPVPTIEPLKSAWGSPEAAREAAEIIATLKRK